MKIKDLLSKEQYVVAVVLVIAVISVIYQLISDRSLPYPVDVVEDLPTNVDDANKQLTISELLNRANFAESELRLTSPIGHNSVFYYRKVLQLDTGNTEAIQGLRRVAAHYIAWVKRDLAREDFYSADLHLEKARGLDPSHPGIDQLEAELEARTMHIVEDRQQPEFPWPPPQASAIAKIPNNFFLNSTNDIVRLADIDSKINVALDNSAYFERSYYSVPDGFAMVTRLENINPDGTPKSGRQRWAVEVGPLRSFSLAAYLKALFTSNPGYYRIIVFVVTPHPFTQTDDSVERQEALAWLHRGTNKLPPEVAIQSYTEGYSCTALIYEFEKIAGDQIASTILPGKLLGRTHLEQSKLWDGLQL